MINQQLALSRDGLIWRVSDDVCALQDNEQHLGHVLKTDHGWHAYDATHLNLQNDGMRDLGYFAGVEAAKAAVEASVASRYEKQSLRKVC